MAEQMTWDEYRAKEATDRLAFINAAVDTFGTQGKAAEALGVSRNYVARIIHLKGLLTTPNDARGPKPPKLIKFAGA